MYQPTTNNLEQLLSQVPGQSSNQITNLQSENITLSKAALAMKAGKMIVWENGPVMALAGDADNPAMPFEIGRIKQDRSPNQPVGWVSTFRDSVPAFDLKNIKDEKLISFLTDPSYMTRRLGGLAFIRVAADMDYKRNFKVPDSIIPVTGIDSEPSNVQIYSPTGNYRCSKLVRYANVLGLRIAMTSANHHKEKELVEFDEAEKFAELAGNLAFFPEYAQGRKMLRPRGSYPVIKVENDCLKIVRYGFLSPEIIERILYDLPVDTSPTDNSQSPNHPENVLREDDLPEVGKHCQGQRLRDLILANFINYGQKKT